jgi:hypothetical protein
VHAGPPQQREQLQFAPSMAGTPQSNPGYPSCRLRRARAKGALSLNIRHLACTSCHAPLRTEHASGSVVRCEYCGTELRVAGRGALLLEANLVDPSTPGWTRWMADGISWAPGPPPEVVASIAGDGQSFEILTSAGTFDDFEAATTVRFLSGDFSSHGGLKFRRRSEGLYQLAVNAQGEFSLFHLATGMAARTFVGWGTKHAAVRAGINERNQLRVVCVGERIRAFVNGTMVASIRDSASSFGSVSVFGQSRTPMSVAFSSLSVREPDGE